jgi:hypothetical protein
MPKGKRMIISAAIFLLAVVTNLKGKRKVLKKGKSKMASRCKVIV